MWLGEGLALTVLFLPEGQEKLGSVERQNWKRGDHGAVANFTIGA